MERDNQDLYTKSVAGAEEENPGEGGKITTTENLCCLGCLFVGIELKRANKFIKVVFSSTEGKECMEFHPPLLIIAVIYRRITLRFRCHGNRVRLFLTPSMTEKYSLDKYSSYFENPVSQE